MHFTLNGKRVEVQAHPLKRLLDVLREECGLTGTKEGCGEGECGACTVLIDGTAVNACLVPFAHAEGRTVLTIEGLGGRHPLQEAFVTEGGTQCGICTPGMIMAAVALPPHPTPEQVRTGLAGNICRCTGYMGIYRAIEKASQGGHAARRDKPASGRKATATRTRQPRAKASSKPAGRTPVASTSSRSRTRSGDL